MKKTTLTTFLFLTIVLSCFAQTNFNKEKLDSYFKVLEENNKFMGSVAVSKNEKVIYSKTIGFSDLENKVRASNQSKYRIGSISKSFSAVLIFKAIEENKLELDQPINKWFPKIKNANSITVAHLLGHRSGIHSYTSGEDYLSWNTQAKTEEEMLKIIENGGSDFPPDSIAKYSNSNYLLLSYILEKTYSKSYSELLQKQITKPLGLIDTYVFGEINTANNECKSYRYNGSGSWELEVETDYTVPLGAGAITSTPIDLTKFADALFGGKLLKSESLEKMKTIKDRYGMGLFQFPFYDKVGYGHTGGIDGFSSIYAHFPEDSISYALTSNGSNYNNNNISLAILSAIYNKPYDIPEFSTYNVNTDDLDKYLGVYASEEIALEITITKEENTLIAQGTGQPKLPLEATRKDIFEFNQAGAKFQFNPSESTMILFQGGGQIEFKRK